jgi:hypothetical protein
MLTTVLFFILALVAETVLHSEIQPKSVQVFQTHPLSVAVWRVMAKILRSLMRRTIAGQI